MNLRKDIHTESMPTLNTPYPLMIFIGIVFAIMFIICIYRFFNPE